MNFESHASASAAPEFSVVLAFDNCVAKERALGLVTFLNQRFGYRIEIQCTQCGFRQLEDQRFSIEAVDAAASADMVILATSDGEQLPAAVRRWMEHWLLRRKNRRGALIATVEQRSDSPRKTNVHSYLHEAAAKAGITFFAGAF